MGEKAGWKEATAKGNGEGKYERIWPSVMFSAGVQVLCGEPPSPGQVTLRRGFYLTLRQTWGPLKFGDQTESLPGKAYINLRFK